MFLAGVMVLSGLVAAVSLVRTPEADAIDNSQFRPGQIISDAVFFNPTTMSVAQIQAFLDTKGARCTGAWCLKNINFTSVGKAADQYCAGYPAPGAERAAAIIYKVAQSCGINPQVILVMLQKEQGLVTSSTPPTDARYRAAMGMGCPDTSACDAQYYGFANQVYAGIRQMRVYERSGRYTWYRPGSTVTVRYHPNAACGGAPVYIENQATANLYYYTPYQPNAASLAAGAGTGDACSSYGNRNFHRYFTEWFGTAQATGDLVKTASSPDIYLTDAGRRYRLSGYDSYVDLLPAFGTVSTISAADFGALVDAGVVGNSVRNSSTGYIAYVERGVAHPYPSCAVVTLWVGRCDGATNLSSSTMLRFRSGEAMSAFAHVESPEAFVQLLSPTSARPYVDAVAARSKGMPAWVATMDPTTYATRTPQPVASATLVHTTTSPDVYLADQGRRWKLSSGLAYKQLASIFGPSVVTPAAYVDGLAQQGTTGSTLRNASTGYIAAAGGGQWHPYPDCATVAAWVGSCSGATTVSADTMSAGSPGAPMSRWFAVESSPTRAQLVGPGVAQMYASWSAVVAAGIPSWVAEMDAATYAGLVKRPAVAPLVRSQSSPTVFLRDGSARWKLADYGEYVRLSSVFGPAVVVPDATVAALAEKGTTGSVLRGTGAGFIARIEGGAVHPFPDCATVTVWVGSCLASTPVSDELLAAAPRGPAMTAWFRSSAGSPWGLLRTFTTGTTYPTQPEATAAGMPAWVGELDQARVATLVP